MSDGACTAASSLTVRVTIGRSYRGLSVYRAVDLTRSVLMGDEACTAASSLTVRVTIEMRGGRWPCNGNPTRQRGSSD